MPKGHMFNQVIPLGVNTKNLSNPGNVYKNVQ